MNKNNGKSPMAPNKPTNPYAKPFPLKCFKCSQVGHRSSDCPQRRLLQIQDVDDDFVGTTEEFDYEEMGDTELVVGDDGEALICIIQKLLFSSKTQAANQRNAIFKTCLTIKGKVCEVIIDGGSCENVMSKNFVKALQLTIEKHHQP